MQDIIGEMFAWIFMIFVFFLVFILPVWFVIRHAKKSKLKLQDAQKVQAKETPKQALQRRLNHNLSIGGSLAGVAGILVGARLLGSPLIGFILALIFSSLAVLIIKLVHKKKNTVTFDTTLTRSENGEVRTGPIPADDFLEVIDSGKDFRITTKESYKRISDIKSKKKE